MKRIELYSLEEINNYLSGLKYIQYSHLISAKGLFPIGDDKVRVENASFFSKSSPGFKEGYQRTRRLLREYMTGCDLYFEIKDVPETAEMRRDLSQGKVVVEVDDNGVGTIAEKKYFFLRDVPAPMKTKMKGINFSDIAWVIPTDNDFKISFTEPSADEALFAQKGSLITVTDINKIKELGFGSFLLGHDHFSTYVQHGTKIEETSLEDNLDTTVVFNEKDEIPVSPSRIPTERITTFYEYDAREERPTFGEYCELINIGKDANGEIIWIKMPKIIQNEHNEEYADRADAKKVRTVVELTDQELAKILPELNEKGKTSHLVEFAVIEEMGSDFLIEKKNYVKQDESQFHM